MEQKKLYRSATNRTICGVCGGIGEYLNIDPTLVRLIWGALLCGKLRNGAAGLHHCGGYHAGTADVKA